MKQFTQHKFTQNEIKTIFFPQSPRKCNTCHKMQTRKKLLPDLFSNKLQKLICTCSEAKKKSKEKKQKAPPEHENSNEKDIQDFNDFQNINDQVHLSQNNDNRDGMSQNVNNQSHLPQNDNNGDLNNNANDFVTRGEFNLCINRLETEILGLKNDMQNMKSGIDDLKANVNGVLTALSNNNLKE